MDLVRTLHRRQNGGFLSKKEVVYVAAFQEEEIVGNGLVDEWLMDGYVGRGVPVGEYLPTKATFEQAFVAEVLFCAEANGVDGDAALAYIDSGASGWWLNRTIAVDRSRIAQEGSGLVAGASGGQSLPAGASRPTPRASAAPQRLPPPHCPLLLAVAASLRSRRSGGSPAASVARARRVPQPQKQRYAPPLALQPPAASAGCARGS